MSDLAARKADLDFELAQAKTEACLNAIYKEHPELVVCAANTKMLVEYCREGFGEPTMENLRIAVADPNSANPQDSAGPKKCRRREAPDSAACCVETPTNGRRNFKTRGSSRAVRG
jgi:hypothetical protein